MDNVTRKELFDCYRKMDKAYNTIKEILQHEGGYDYDLAKAYWLSYIDQGISAADTFSGQKTFRDYLVSNDIMDDEEEFIEYDDDDEYVED